MSKLVVFTMGGKGGVGKTAIMTSLAEYYQSNNIPIGMVDCDTENGKSGCLNHFFPEANKINIREPDGLDIFIDIASENDKDVLIADLGAGSGVDLINWFRVMYPICVEYGIEFLAIGSITANPGSIDTVFTWTEFLQKNVKYLIVKNQFQGDTTLWDNSHSAEKLKKIFTPDIITMPTRIPKWQTELENHGLTLSRAMESKLPMFSKISARCRLHMWRKQIFSEFDKVKDILIPASA
ncbi:MAG: hypothetical protein K9L78_04860 [Victivallales bacterium]|nr:hypothetical protein [Victivallales bacterium]MCF7889433.1 hypothetical protein [Victivallales bacterium]